MPLKKGFSKEVVGQNIKEMIQSGRPQRQAIAAALTSARKYKKMAEGGMAVDEDDTLRDDMDADAHDDLNENSVRDLNELQALGESHPNDVQNPSYQDAEKLLARHLFEKSEAGEEEYADGGLVEEGTAGDEPAGNKPEESMASEVEAPMSISQDAMDAIALSKKRRRAKMGLPA